jgi:predicted nucleotidyltransferase
MTRLEHLVAQRVDARRKDAEAATARVLTGLRSRGVVVEIVGSLARGSFDLTSDVDFLVLSCPPHLRYAIEADVEDEMAGLPFDVIYLDEVRSDVLRQKLLAEAGHASAAD